MLNRIPLVESLESKARSIRTDSVYDSKESAIDDMNRLVKLGDMEGIKLRVIQIYREKQEQDGLISE